jgi:hypothetical protein
MANGNKAENKVNWTALGVGALVVGGGIVLWKILETLTGPSPEEQKIIDEILHEWQSEFDQLKSYSETIYANGRTPSDQEIAVLSSMLDQMSLKEQTMVGFSSSGFDQLVKLIREMAADWWLVPITVASITILPIGGYMTYKLVKEWKNRRGPPPNFPCPFGDGFVGATADQLKHHLQTNHPATAQFAGQAQQSFAQASTWVQNAVAVESYYAATFTNWRSWSLPALGNLGWAVTSAWVYGIGAAADSALLLTLLPLLLI